jgi:hypothetical protein
LSTFLVFIFSILAAYSVDCQNVFPIERYEGVRAFDIKPFSSKDLFLKRRLIELEDGQQFVVFVDKKVLKDTVYDDSIDVMSRKGRVIDAEGKDLGSQNCHGYVCGQKGVPGIRENYWVEGAPSSLNENTNGMKTILNTYFKHVTMMMSWDMRKVEFGKELQEGDIIVFHDSQGNYAHSGIVFAGKDGGIWVRSKLGEGVVSELHFFELAEIYPAPMITIYR